MEFEWDEDKRLSVLAQRGVDFYKAMLIFERPVLTRVDNRRAYGEERLISLGMVEGNCYVVVHTTRNGVTRIISCWKGGRREQAEYQARIAR